MSHQNKPEISQKKIFLMESDDMIFLLLFTPIQWLLFTSALQ